MKRNKKSIMVISGVIAVILLGLFLGYVIRNINTNHIDGSIIVDGIKRTYHIYIPSTYDAKKPVPLLIVLHGGGGNGKNMEEKTTLRGFDKLAEKEGFIVVYPDAVRGHWNDGRNDPYSYSAQHNIDDVGFISTLINHLEKNIALTARGYMSRECQMVA